MQIMVTGAAGFIGAVVVDQLERRGHQVVGVDAFLPAAHARDAAQRAPRVQRLDLQDESALTDLLTGVDLVVHKAAMVGLGSTAHDAPAFVTNNVAATASLLSAMARAGVSRLVQASSMVVYGPGRGECAEHGQQSAGERSAADVAAGRYEPTCPVVGPAGRCGGTVRWRTVSEEDRTDPRSTYAATKLAQEHLALAWAAQTQGRAVSLRHHNVYGPGMPANTPYAGVASIFRSALANGEAPQVYEDGRQMRDFIHVDDVARATVTAAEWIDQDSPGSGDGVHHTFNVASGQPRTVLDLASALSQAMGGAQPAVVGGGRAGDVRHVVADPRRIRHTLGFVAQVGFAEGVADFAAKPQRAS